MFFSDLIIILPQIFLLTAIMLLLLLGTLFNNSLSFVSYGLSSLISSVSFLVLAIVFILYLNIPVYDCSIFLYQLELSFFNTTLYLFILFLYIFWFFIYRNYIRYDGFHEFEFLVISLFVLTGINIILISNDFISLYIGIELQSLSLYLLASSKISSKFSTEAGLKYFILGSFASAIFLLGMFFFYLSTGLTNFSDIKLLLLCGSDLPNLSYIYLSFFFLTIGLFFKLGLAPFHMWLPDVYEGSPTIITAFFSILPKVALFFLLFKFYILFYNLFNFGTNFIYIYCSLLSITIGTISGLVQFSWKRLFAYSTIAHSGFILLGFLSNSFLGIVSIYFYIFVYLLMSLNLFYLFMSFRSFTDYSLIKSLSSLTGISSSNILLSCFLSLLLFSMAGIPPLYGFFIKLYILSSLILNGWIVLGLIAVLLSVVSSIYYLKIIRLLFFNSKVYYSFFVPLSYSYSLVIVLLAYLSLFISFFSSFFLDYLYILVLYFFL